MADEFDEENIIGIRLAYDISELPVKDITNAIEVASVGNINNPIPVANEYNFGSKDKDQEPSIGAGNSETITFTPPTDKAWIIKNFYIDSPSVSGASSGTHRFIVYQSGILGLLYLRSTYDNTVSFSYGTAVANDKKNPSTDIACQNALFETILTPNQPLKVDYYNNTDSDNGATRKCRLLYQEVRETT